MVVPDDFFWWIGEGTVVVIEASILAFVLPLPVRDSLLASMLCNLSSLAFGSLALRVLEHSRGSAWAW